MVRERLCARQCLNDDILMHGIDSKLCFLSAWMTQLELDIEPPLLALFPSRAAQRPPERPHHRQTPLRLAGIVVG